jgi:homoserine kinase
MKRAKAFAPASIGNVAVGFDLLGFSFSGAGDVVELEWDETDKNGGVEVLEIKPRIKNFDTSKIPKDSLRNTSAVAAQALLNSLNLPGRVRMKIEKGIPLSSGMGGSAASAVAAVVALNSLLEKPASWREQLTWALEGERVASGSTHLDNVLPCLRGGLNLIAAPGQYVQYKVSDQLLCVLVHPEIEVQTRFARSVLSETIPLKLHVEQAGYLAGFLTAVQNSDWALLSATLKDVVIEPQRQKLIPGFGDAKAAALRSGALGFSISGSGPTVFAMTNEKPLAENIVKAVQEVFEKNKIESQAWIANVNAEGAKVL